MQPIERRRYRSNRPETALRFQLEASRQDARLEALALADGSGLLVAYAGATEHCEELGAVAPLLARAQALPCNQGELASADVAVRPVDCLGEQLYLISSGTAAARDAALTRSAAGVKRILQQHAA